MLGLTPRNVMFVFKNQATTSTNEALSYKCLTFKRNKKVLITQRKESVQLVTHSPREHRAFKIITLTAFPIIISDLLSLSCLDIPVER